MFKTPFLEDRHMRLSEQVTRFVREHVRGATLGETEDEQSRSLVRRLAGEGLLAHTVPVEAEGSANALDV